MIPTNKTKGVFTMANTSYYTHNGQTFKLVSKFTNDYNDEKITDVYKTVTVDTGDEIDAHILNIEENDFIFVATNNYGYHKAIDLLDEDNYNAAQLDACLDELNIDDIIKYESDDFMLTMY